MSLSDVTELRERSRVNGYQQPAGWLRSLHPFLQRKSLLGGFTQLIPSV